MLNIPPSQSVNNSGSVEVAANYLLLFIFQTFVVDILYIFDVTTVQLEGG